MSSTGVLENWFAVFVVLIIPTFLSSLLHSTRAHLRCYVHLYLAENSIWGVPEWCVDGKTARAYLLHSIGVENPIAALEASE